MSILKNWLIKRKAKKIAKQLCTQHNKKKKKTIKESKKTNVTINNLKKKIAEEAYRLAQKNGFDPEFDKDNWINAERKVLQKIKL